jgi:hypothetical protein
MYDDIQKFREICNEIGCIMEEASVVALVWVEGDGLSLEHRLEVLRDAHTKIGTLLNIAVRHDSKVGRC